MATALHSLTIRDRNDAAHILEMLLKNIRCLRKLRIHHDSWVSEDITGLFANIVVLYPDLEVLSLAGYHQLTSAGCHLIPRLKKLSELKLSCCQVHYVCVKLLNTHIYIFEYMLENTLRNTYFMYIYIYIYICIYIYIYIYLGKKEIYYIFKTCCIISVLFSTKWHLFHDFIIICSSNTFFIKHVLKFKYPPVG